MMKLYFRGKTMFNNTVEGIKEALQDNGGMGTFEWIVLIIVILIIIFAVGSFLYTTITGQAFTEIGNLINSIFNIDTTP